MKYLSKIKFVGLMLFALPLAISSCKDYNEDAYNQMRVDNLQKLAEMQNQLTDLANKLDSLKLQKGEDGATPEIGANGNWWIGGTDTGVKAAGQDGHDGQDGEDGATPEIGANGNWWIGGTDTGVKAAGQDGQDGHDGQDGLTPRIGDNGNWWIGDTDTGVKAAGRDGNDGHDGVDGQTPRIGDNGNWWIGNTDTGVPATGAQGFSAYEVAVKNGFTGTEAEWLATLKGQKGDKGDNGNNGADGATPEIGANGNWWIGGVDTGVKASGNNGSDGHDGATPEIGANGNWWIGGVDTGVKAKGTDAPYVTSVALVGDKLVFYFSDGSQKEATVDASWKCDEDNCKNAVNVCKEITKAFGLGDGVLSDTPLNNLGSKLRQALLDIENALKYIDALKKRATSISVDGINNSVFGMMKTSLGVSTNMLMGFYGNVANAVTFPSTNAANYADNAVLLDDSYVTLGKETVMPGDVYTEKLGTAYFSINPAQIDFTGVDVNLTNTQGSNHGLALSTVKSSNETLKMGYTPTRATAGFYEAAATVEDFDQVEKIELNTDDYEALVKAVKNGENRVSSLVNALQTTAESFRTDAYALKIETSDALSTADGNKHTVMSPYAIQAALIKPVGYDLTAKLPTSVPGYGRVVNAANKVIEKVINKLQNNSDLVAFQNTLNNLKDIQHVSISIAPGDGTIFEKDSVEIKFELNKLVDFEVPFNEHVTVYDNAGNVIGYTDINTTAHGTYNFVYNVNEKVYVGIKITEQDLAEVYRSLNSQVDDAMEPINKMIDNVNDAVNQGLNLINKLRDTSLTGNVQNKVTSIIEKAWNVMDRVYSAAETRFELAMIIKNGNNWSIASEGVNGASIVNGNSFTAYLTNLNAEMLVPAYKKHLCVTNVWGAADKATAINAVNASAQLNKVLDGTTKSVSVAGLQSGLTYEFSYSGLDFSGKQLTRKFYVKCK